MTLIKLIDKKSCGDINTDIETNKVKFNLENRNDFMAVY